MAIILSDITCTLGTKDEDVLEMAAKILHVSLSSAKFSIFKYSVDARRGEVRMVYSVLVEGLNGENEFAEKALSSHVRVIEEKPFVINKGVNPLASSPVIVGFGPAGLFAALLLAQQGFCPVVLERGENIDNRINSVGRFFGEGVLNTESNVQFGEGGAGTFSDGKLTTRINDPLCRFVLEQLVKFGAPNDILVKAKPHIGTDQLRNVVKAIREEIIRLGGKVLFNSKMTSLGIKNGRVNSVTTPGLELNCEAVILAIGHSARDTFALLASQGISFAAKPFSVGVRIEHLQSDINAALYGSSAGHPDLPPAEYQLSLRKGDNAVYTFCMCPGGSVVAASSEEGGLVTNGMSSYQRNLNNANSALVVSVDASDFGNGVFDGMEFQRSLERKAFVAGGGSYFAPAQNVGAFLEKRLGLDCKRIEPSYPIGVRSADFNNLFPTKICSMLHDGLRAFNQRQAGFAAQDAILTGVETRTSSPVRICRNENFQSVSVNGLYPCGEGAGYAGGIMSAAVDGLKTAMAIIQEYKPN